MVANTSELMAKFTDLVKTGHIAMVLEMASQSNGRVVIAREWETIAECCEKTGLYLIVDGVFTAFRCGAPFTYQLPRYLKYKSSFVVFGKAVGASGLALVWDGVFIRRFGLADPQREREVKHFIHIWDYEASRTIEPNDTLRSWGYILLSEKYKWCELAVQIGHNLRSAFSRRYPDIVIKGEAALIYLDSDVARKTSIIGAAVNGTTDRWLPYLDEGMADIDGVEELFNRSGKFDREMLAKSDDNLIRLRYIGCSDHIFEPGYGPPRKC